MVSLSGFLFIYVLGGITFIPLLLGAILIHAYYTLPIHDPESKKTPNTTEEKDGGRRREDDGQDTFKFDLGNLPEELKVRTHEPDVAAGYFAVCREYVPGGVNGKPPERTTPAGEVVAAESPSVYKSMYRSIFDRNKSQVPTLDDGKGTSRPIKNARNVFFVVLRHGHLMLYDDVEQLEVRHVISLAYHDIDVYAGGETIPEGELWIKRNCIRLIRRRVVGDLDSETKPFYLFSENCSQKEDFYHAMLANQERRPGTRDSPPTPMTFDTQHIIKLVQQLHASEETLQTRWINAVIGRVFLALYKTPELEDFVRMKITKKIARVPKPALISEIAIQKIDMGHAAPMITHPKLKELTVDGELTCEMDVHYKGDFSIEILAVARIDLGARFKTQQVNLVLAGILKKLEGHLLVRIKPPPSNRIWISFETAPHVEMDIRPIVSSRQITYGIILRAIESRIREVIAETLVMPNWDDIPFHDSLLQRFRGGIWSDDSKLKPFPDPQTEAAEKGLVEKIDKSSDSDDSDLPLPSQSMREKTMSMPSLVETGPSRLTYRKSLSAKSVVSLDATTLDKGQSSGSETTPLPKPKAMRSSSFASAATPIVNLDSATVESLKSPSKHVDATSAIRDISMRSPPESPVRSPPQPSIMESVGKKNSISSIHSQTSQEFIATDLPSLSPSPPKRTSTQASTATTDTTSSNESAKSKYANSIMASRASLNQATAAAKKWFANRQAQQNASSHTATFSAKDAAAIMRGEKELEHAESYNPPPGTPSNPIGRGQPLPPPGTPLPHPHKPRENTGGGWYLTKRKPLGASPAASQPHTPAMPATPTRHTSSSASSTAADVAAFLDGGPPVSREPQEHHIRDDDPDAPSHPQQSSKSSNAPTPSRMLPPLSSSHDSTSPGSGTTSLGTSATLGASSKPPATSSASAQTRKSSTASLTSAPAASSPRPGVPPRRQRLSVARNNGHTDGAGDEGGFGGLLVVEAPVVDGSPLGSPEIANEDPMAREGRGRASQRDKSDDGDSSSVFERRG